jgi:hypothetical protein
MVAGNQVRVWKDTETQTFRIPPYLGFEMTPRCRVRYMGDAVAVPFSEEVWPARRRHLVEKVVDDIAQTYARNSKKSPNPDARAKIRETIEQHDVWYELK